MSDYKMIIPNLTDKEITEIKEAMLWWSNKGPKVVYDKLVRAGISERNSKMIVEKRLVEESGPLRDRGIWLIAIGFILSFITAWTIFDYYNGGTYVIIGWISIIYVIGPGMFFAGCFDIYKSSKTTI